MKSTERRHLKDNDLAVLATNTRQMIDERRKEVTGTIAVIAVLGVVALGWFGWRQYVQSGAQTLLAEALVLEGAPVGPPTTPGVKEVRFATEREKLEAELAKYKATADQYPSTDAGIFARYREASIQMALGKPTDAATLFQDVVSRGGSRVYGQMAQLGLAEAQANSGSFDQAITTFKALSENKDATIPVDGVLMQLGRAYRDAGKKTEAQQTFNRIVEEFPESPFTMDAKRELDNLKKG